MNTYKYNDQTLRWEEVSSKRTYYFFLLGAVLFLLLGFTSAVKVNTIVEKIPVIILENQTEFSPENLKKEIDRLNIKFGHIVYKQAVLESANFNSYLFKESNNLFGMKKASSRTTSFVGEEFNHAVFKTWQESVLDMAIWNGIYCKNIKTEEQYYQLLQAVYAEDPLYITKLKAIP